jgi:methionyl-tRNA formyltransferase
VRIAFFGSGSPLSTTVLSGLSDRHEIVAVVIPDKPVGRRDPLRRLFGMLPKNPLTKIATERGAKTFGFSRNRLHSLRSHLARVRPDVIAVASFPSFIPPDVLQTAKHGGLNLHQSLLPAGRGPDPIFWSYYNDDTHAGSTIHWLDDAFDHGDILSQEAVAIARGRSCYDLYFELARLGSRQFNQAIDAVEAQHPPRQPQDESRATYHKSPFQVPWRVSFDVWNAERTWHFLSGVGAMIGALCRDPSGHLLPMGPASGYAIENHHRVPGTYETTSSGLRLFCPDGVVEVKRSPAAQ